MRPRPAPAATAPVVTAAPVEQRSAEPEQEPQTSRPRRLGVIIGAIVVAVLVAAGIVAAILVPGLNAPAPANTPVAGGGGVIDVSSVPAPVLVSKQASADGSAVTFVWKNPKPKKGDQYLWALGETPDKKTQTAEPQAVVTGIIPGSRVCITAFVLRSGITSANPLAVCYP